MERGCRNAAFFLYPCSLNFEKKRMFAASTLLERINAHISALQFTRAPQGLYTPIAYVLSMGGKRIRPVLMLMAYNLYREDITRIFAPATGIEVYHNYTLLHDDLMDRADRRRGKDTVHRVWGDNTAILSGDAMLVMAYQFMAQCPEEKIRTMEVSSRVSPIATLDFVRKAMVAQQLEMGKAKGIVMDGRDIGTTVFPDAELKIFVTATPEIRAQRRYDELKAKGEEACFDEILENVKQRDYIDQNREVSPLRKADDALLLDNSHMTILQQKEWLAEQFKRVTESK